MVSMQAALRVNIPDAYRNWVESRLVSMHIRNVLPMAAGLMLNLLVAVIACWQSVNPIVLTCLAGTIIGGDAYRVQLAGGLKRAKVKTDPNALIKSFTRNSILLGAASGFLVAYAMPLVSPTAQIVLMLSAATQLGALAFNIRTIPSAAIWHIGLIGMGMAIGLLELNSYIAWTGVALIVAATMLQANMIRVAHKSSVDRILKEREINTTTQTVKMLLNDYEEHGSDWIFELDKDGCMLSVSDRFAEAVGKKPEQMNGRAFAALFTSGSALKDLKSAIAEGEARRSICLKLSETADGEPRWWSISLRALPASLIHTTRFRGVISDISAERQAEARVLHMANYDSLTDLPNRLMFTTSLARMFKDVVPHQNAALMLVDCDNFKTVNDMYGHPVGDQFLKAVANRLRDTVEASGLGGEGFLIARLGGDEFAVLMSGEDIVDKAIRLAEHLTETCARPYEVAGHEIDSSISLGISLAPSHALSPEALTTNADIALYAAKDTGRNRWEMFQSGMDAELQKRHALAKDMRSAVAKGELRLFLQPLVNVETRKQTGFEALMRWEHPERGMVMPNDFIPIAEETGLIVPMGEWMIRTALKEAASWSEPHSIAINLSPVQVRSPGLITVITSALAESGIDPARVEFEITETVLMNESEANIQLLNQLHMLGVKVALDDFGTGYASLSYLLTFPFDKIKIDRSFVNDLEGREESRAIVAAVISLANRLGMCTLAEGVEQEAQLIKLREQGCEMVQGWLFGKALPADHYSRDLVDVQAEEPRKVA